MTETAQSEFPARLLTMRSDLERGSEITADERKPVELDQTSVGRLTRMDAMLAQAMQVEAERRRQLERRRIDAALAWLDDGEFGYCLVCGGEIEPKRLLQDPAVPNCISYARAKS
jgi:DnaK suppressor protein